MKIIKTQFITSATSYAQCPTQGAPVFAFLGRSNVGKSSLINMLLGAKRLAKTSAVPGKTSTINYYQVNESWYIADLPGYGWPYTSPGRAKQWANMVEGFLKDYPDLTYLFLLIDSRHDPLQIDLHRIEWLIRHEIPFTIVLTKSDKIKKRLHQARGKAYVCHCQTHFGITPTALISSATHQQGRDAILKTIEGCCQAHDAAS
ncbi:MAG: ribosome biogenesis GTP-binding protein YihA/YsxC [Cytophagales bacterium]